MAYIDSLPTYIKTILFSSEFNSLLIALKESLNFTSEQREALEDVLGDLFQKTIKPEDLTTILQSRLGVTTEEANKLEQTFFINIVLPFADFFGNHLEYFQKKYGDPEKALAESKTMPLLLKTINDALRGKAQEIEDLDNRRDKEAVDMATLFEKNLVCHFYTPDAPYKASLNNTIIFLISNVEGFVDTLLKALYANEEQIGKETLRVGDKDGQPPTVNNWIQDLLGFSGGTASSIKIAQYMTDNVNAKKLLANDKEALRRLFETFSVLKNFPESFQKTSPEHWMIIPYHLAEEETKTARELPAVPGQEQELRITNYELRTEKAAAEKGSGTPPSGGKPDPVSESPLNPKPYTLTPVPLPDYDRVIAHIFEVASVKLSDEVVGRVKPILSSRIRNVRNSIDTGERLKAALTDGGAGLSSEDADKLLKEANTAAQAVAGGKVVEYLPTEQAGGLRITDYGLAQGQENKGSSDTGIPDQVRDDSKKQGNAAVEMTQADTGSSIVKARPVLDTGSEMTATDSGIATVAVLPRNDIPTTPSPLDPNPYSLAPTMVIKEVDGVPTLVEKKNGNGKKKEDSKKDGIAMVASLTTRLPQADNDIPAVAIVSAPEVVPSPSLTAKPSTLTPSPEPLLQPMPPLDGTPPKAVATLTPSIPIPVTVRAVPTSGQVKKPVADVKAPPRLVGVVDEIRALTIKDFRRLSQDAKESAKRIYQKIQALEKESLTKKADAIKAWKESDVYALYLEIGQINIGVDMNKLIEERKGAGKEYLTTEEFDALLDLNEKLRF